MFGSKSRKDAMPEISSPQSAVARRRRGIIGAAVVILALAFGSIAAPAQAAQEKVTASLSATKYTVTPGQAVTLKATLKRGTKALGTATVKVQQRVSGTTTWTTLKSTKTTSAGTVSVATGNLRKNTEFRVVYAGSASFSAATSAVRTVAVTQKLTVTSTTTKSPTVGDTVALSGTASAGAIGSKVALQFLSEGTWVSVASATVTAKSTFSVSARATQGGKQQYRVRLAASPGITSVNSSAISFSVYAWYNLADLPKVGSSRFGVLGTTAIAGVNYVSSVGNIANFWWDNDPYGEWNLSYRCTKLRATLGLSDDSASGSSVLFSAYADSVETAFSAMSIGQARTIEVDVRSAFRLKIVDHFIAGPSGSGPAESYGVWGNARVLCAGTP
jgi:hypothetical protein